MKFKQWIGVLLCILLSVDMLPSMAFAANEADTGNGTADTSWYNDSENEFDIDPAAALAGVSVQAEVNNVSTWDGTVDTSWFNQTDKVFTIDTAAKLAGVSELANNGDNFPDGAAYNRFKGITLNLTTDIDLNGLPWTPIKYFAGTFNGGGHTVYNMKIEQLNGESTGSGFFRWLSNATVKDLVLENATVVVTEKDTESPALYYGILAGCANGGVSIYNCGVTGSITVNLADFGEDDNNAHVSGFIGACHGNNSLQNCWSFADVKTTNDIYATVGGLVG